MIYKQEIIWFIHTDVSDKGMAQRLTTMVDYNTVYSPTLGAISQDNVGTLYVFMNGIKQDDTQPWT